MNNQTYRITLNAAALLPLAQGKLECVNLINWYPAMSKGLLSVK